MTSRPRFLRRCAAVLTALPTAFALVVVAAAPGHAAVLLHDSFEGRFDPAWTRIGDVTTTTAHAHGFAHSFLSFPTDNADDDMGYLKVGPIGALRRGFVSAWFYDDGGSDKAQQLQVRESAGVAAGDLVAIGVFSPVLNSNYGCSTAGFWNADSGVARTVGWRELRIEWTHDLAPEATAVRYVIRIDGVPVCWATKSWLPQVLMVGDAWSYIDTQGWGYWDDVTYATDPA